MRAPLRKSTLVALAAGAVFAPQAWAKPPAPCGGTPDNRRQGRRSPHEYGRHGRLADGVRPGAFRGSSRSTPGSGHRRMRTPRGRRRASLRHRRADALRPRATFPGGVAPTFDQGTWTRGRRLRDGRRDGRRADDRPGGTVTFDVPAWRRHRAGTPVRADLRRRGGSTALGRSGAGRGPPDVAPGADFVAGSCRRVRRRRPDGPARRSRRSTSRPPPSGPEAGASPSRAR